MTTYQGRMSFPGVSRIISGEMTLSHGISPGIATLRLSPQSGLPASGGNLVISYVDVDTGIASAEITFSNCRVNTMSIRRQNGLIASIQIFDRRWKWDTGEINGSYNIRLPNGEIDTDTEKTPQELATLLLDAQGETGYTITALPNDARPFVDWVSANPMTELQTLCESLGCRVVMGLGSGNPVTIAVTGTGADLSTDRATTAGYGVDPPEIPDTLKVVGGKVRFQSRLKLEAVGEETDGTFEAINDLSYKPAGGWEPEYPGQFYGVSDKEERALALKSVYRLYRVVSQADDTQDVPGCDITVTEVSQILPLSDVKIQTMTDGDGVERAKPASIDGIFFDNQSPIPSWENTEEGTQFIGDFRVNAELGIVEFAQPVYKYNDSTGKTDPAELILTTSYSVTDPDTHQKIRHDRERSTGGSYGTGPRVLRHDEIVGTAIAVYDAVNINVVDSVTDNLTAFNEEADYYLDAVEVEYQDLETNEIEYARIVAISPDGAIQQVSWSVGPQGALTRASRNTEHDLTVPGYKERRRRERVEAIAKVENELNTAFAKVR